MAVPLNFESDDLNKNLGQGTATFMLNNLMIMYLFGFLALINLPLLILNSSKNTKSDSISNLFYINTSTEKTNIVILCTSVLTYLAILIFEHMYSHKFEAFKKKSKVVSGSDFTVVIKDLPTLIESTSLSEQILEIFITSHIHRLTQKANL